ncbi:MAG: MarR family winged helix-turn-helix transcriptional regulator [Acetobacteraceae bacterium]
MTALPRSTLPEAAPAGAGLLFLREEEIRLAQDLLFFAYRDFTNAADVILTELGLGRAHHRALHFIGGNPGITVSDLLGLLRITKQSLARVLSELVARGYVAQAQGHADRRQRLLTLTPAGVALERRLFERQRDRLADAYRAAGGGAVDGFRRVMRGIMDEAARDYLDRRKPPRLG